MAAKKTDRSAWSCDDKPAGNQACRNPYGCHCREITNLVARATAAEAAIARLRDALEAIGGSIKDGLTENGKADHRIILTDGSILRGPAAKEWRDMLVAIRDIALRALNRDTHHETR